MVCTVLHKLQIAYLWLPEPESSFEDRKIWILDVASMCFSSEFHVQGTNCKDHKAAQALQNFASATQWQWKRIGQWRSRDCKLPWFKSLLNCLYLHDVLACSIQEASIRWLVYTWNIRQKLMCSYATPCRNDVGILRIHWECDNDNN